MSGRRLLVEFLDAHGRVKARQRLLLAQDRSAFTIGRGIDADLLLEDPHVAARHAAVEIGDDGRMRVSDLSSLNGINLGRQHLKGVKAMEIGDAILGVGTTRLRIRTSDAMLPPELPVDGDVLTDAFNAPWLLAGGLVVCLVFVFYNSWLGAPQDMAGVVATSLISFVVVSGAWVGAWGFVTRVIRGEWRARMHAGIFYSVLAASIVLDWSMDVVWFALALPSWSLREVLLLMIAAALVLYSHLRGAALISVRRAILVAMLLPMLIGGGSYTVMARNQARNVNYIGADAQLFPPSWRLRSGQSLDDYFSDAMRLKEATDRKRREMPVDENEDM